MPVTRTEGTGYRIAHLPDFHIRDEPGLKRALAMVRHAIAARADHLLFTGDLTVSADTDLAERFWSGLKRLGWAGADRCTFVPGNHDIYGLDDDWPDTLKTLLDGLTYGKKILRSLAVPFHSANRNRAELAKLTASSRKGPDAVQLTRDCPFSVGKVLAGGRVVLAAVDSTRRGVRSPFAMQSGELPKKIRRAAREFLGKHAEARHRVIALHHSPRAEGLNRKVGPFELVQDFAKPGPKKIRRWIRKTGATYVLCGHIHGPVDRRPLGHGCKLLRAGNAGGAVTGGKRTYHIVEFRANGASSCRRLAPGV